MQTSVTAFFHDALSSQGASCCSRQQYFMPFYSRILFHRMHRPPYPQFCLSFHQFPLWAVINTQRPVMYKFNVNICFQFSWLHIQETSGSRNNSEKHLEELPNCFQKHHFTFPSAVYEGSNFSTSLPTLVITCHLLQSPSWA